MCNGTLELVRNEAFWLGETFKIILATSSMVLNGIFVHILYRSSRNFNSAHNCSILINISISCFLVGFASMSKSLWTFWTALSGRWCWLSVPYHALCQFQIGIHLVGQIPALLSFILLTLERIYADLCKKNLTNQDGEQREDENCDWASCIFDTGLILSWGVALIIALLVGLTIDENRKAPYCNGLFIMDTNIILGTVVIVPVVVILSTMLYVILWYKNKRELKRLIKRGTFSIDDRLCLQHNLDITEMALPSVFLHSVLYLMIATSGIVVRFPNAFAATFATDRSTSDSTNNRILFIVTAQFVVCGVTLLFLNLHPLLCLWHGPVLQSQCGRVLPFTQNLWRPKDNNENGWDSQNLLTRVDPWSDNRDRTTKSILIVRNASPGTIYDSEELIPTSSSYLHN